MYFKKGKIIIIAAPSGSGKTTITKFLIAQDLNLVFSVSACSREKRKNEVDGLDYHFLNIADFKKRVESGDFLEWEEVYENVFYGTLKKDVEEELNSGKNVIFDVDVKGALSLKRIFKEQACSIYIDVPLEIIEKRLWARETETREDVLIRLKKTKEESMYKNKFDFIIVNNDLEKTKKEIRDLVREYLQIN